MIRWPRFETARGYVVGATVAALYLAAWVFVSWLPLRCVEGY